MKVLLVAAVVLAVAGNALAANPPVIVSLDPPVAVAGTLTSLQLIVTGTNFTSAAVVRVSGTSRQTFFVSANELRANLVFADLDGVATLPVTVTAAGLTSTAVNFTVLPNTPTITSIDPSAVSAGSGQFTLRVLGDNFATQGRVRVNNSPRETRYVDHQTLEATILGSDIVSPVNLNISVLNPSNRSSNAVVLQSVRGSLTPTLTLLSPDRITAGGNEFTLTIAGRNFDRNAIVKLDNVNVTTTFVNAERVTARVPKTTIAAAKTIQVTVANPNVAPSTPLPLTVLPQKLPILDAISPVSVRAGAGSTQLSANGSNFVSGSIIRVNGVQQTTTFNSANRLTTTLSASQVSTPKEMLITVFTPGTDGGESEAETFTVTSTDAPLINAISPATITVGSLTRTIIVIGTPYADGDVVLINGVERPTTFSTSTQLAATLSEEDVASPGVLQVQVKKKLGGATSASFELRITSGAAPVIDTLAPATAEVGSSGVVLAINGRNFASTSIVTFDSEAHASEFVSGTRINVTLTPADLAVPRDIAVRVTNPDGVSSGPVMFPVIVTPPQLTSIDPPSVAAGDPGFTLNVGGTNLAFGATINFDGVPRATTFNASTGRLSTIVLTSDVSAPRTIQVTVTDRGATSNAIGLAVLRPSIVIVAPAFAFAGSPDLTVVVSGTAFLPTSRVEFKGGERPTTFVSSDALTATLPASALTEIGSFTITVRNSPDALSLPFVFNVVSPGVPVIQSFSPAFATAGSAALELHVIGINFLGDSVIRVNGVNRVTTFISSTELVTTLTGVDLQSSGSLAIEVVASGETSQPAAFPIVPSDPSPRRRAVGP